LDAIVLGVLDEGGNVREGGRWEGGREGGRKEGGRKEGGREEIIEGREGEREWYA